MDFKQVFPSEVNENVAKKARIHVNRHGSVKARLSHNTRTEQAPNQTETSLLLQMVPQLKNSFNVKRKIGEGAFSCVYLAHVKSSQVVLSDQVALKHLIPTSHPNRMLVELQCLQKLGGRNNVMPILTCIRNGGHVVLVMPYFPHDPFTQCVGNLDVHEIRDYMKNLLIALKEVHANGIIHRDVKPSNFLYNRSQRRYSLCDFGLAQFMSKCVNNLPDAKENLITKQVDTNVCSISQAVTDTQIIEPKLGPAFFKLLPPASGGSSHVTSNLQLSLFASKSSTGSNSGQNNSDNVCCCHAQAQVCSLCLSRPAQIAPRAGTPGYRPPEVLLKHPFQTTDFCACKNAQYDYFGLAVDVWSAGIIFLCFLSGHTAFFHSNDDLSSLAEIITLFGTWSVKECARQLGKILVCRPEMTPCNLEQTCQSLRETMKKLNPINGQDLTPAYDLLRQMLALNPNQRISAQQALTHPFFM